MDNPPAAPPFAQPLRESDVDADPIRQFAAWFGQAVDAGARQAEAAALATADGQGAPSVRMVLIKRADAGTRVPCRRELRRLR